jgi:hypothetical protein
MASDSQENLLLDMDIPGAQNGPEKCETVSIVGHRVVTTPVFYAYWRYAAERQRIFYRRLER